MPSSQVLADFADIPIPTKLRAAGLWNIQLPLTGSPPGLFLNVLLPSFARIGKANDSGRIDYSKNTGDSRPCEVHYLFTFDVLTILTFARFSDLDRLWPSCTLRTKTSRVVSMN
jgi:hypothetical protein